MPQMSLSALAQWLCLPPAYWNELVSGGAVIAEKVTVLANLGATDYTRDWTKTFSYHVQLSGCCSISTNIEAHRR